MEITEIECKILRIKAGAILILGMQLGSELQLDTEEKREDVLMQLVAMQRLVEKAEYSTRSEEHTSELQSRVDI